MAKKRKRRVNIKRLCILVVSILLILFLIFKLVMMLFSLNSYIGSNHAYDADKFSYVDGLMNYNDSEYTNITGIDVSSFQNEIDWKKVKKDGIEFAIIRCGFRGVTDGLLYEDPYFKYNIEEAQKAGVPVGVYFFSSAITTEELQEEIDYVYSLIKGYDLQYPVAYDMEYAENARIDVLSNEDKIRFAKTFCDFFNEKGYQTLIYGNINWLTNNLNIEEIKKYNIWYAAYLTTPQLEYPFSIWQYSSSGTVDGIDGRVDMNLYLEKK